MADFSKSLEVLLTWEGGYSNNPRDPGGETYCGISRKNWPLWDGWPIVDEVKLVWNQTIPELAIHVNNFYALNYWNNQSYNLLNNQDIADKIFQHHVNMGVRAIKFAQQVVEDINWDKTQNRTLQQDGQLGPITANAINQFSQQDSFLDNYIERLKHYYKELIVEHPQLKVFKYEWMLRAETIGKRRDRND